MTAKKILLIVLGVLVVIGGFYCVATPGITYLAMIWVIGFMMFFHAIEDIVTYGDRKKEGLANGWNLASAILSCICGLFIVISGAAELVTGVVLLYFLFGWMIASGIISIIGAFRLKRLREHGGAALERVVGKWGWYLALGILMIIAGCFGFGHPLISALSIGLIVGIDIIVSGIQIIVAGIAM
jgi:uncharacterized membrane protein HdeD (DUF308 family)